MGTTTTSALCVESKVTGRGAAPKASRVWRGKAPLARATPEPPYRRSRVHNRSRSAYPEQDHRGCPCVCHPSSEWIPDRLNRAITETEPAAPEASTQKDGHYVYVYIRVPREKMVPVDIVLTETVPHQVFQSSGPKIAAPVLHSLLVYMQAHASQQWRGDVSTISYARISVLQRGGLGDSSVDTVESEPPLEALAQHVAEGLAVPGDSTAAEVKVLSDSGSGIAEMSEELVEALRGQSGMTQTESTQEPVGHTRVVTSLDQKCDIESNHVRSI